ncbi:MAG TPA: UDP-glucose 4-epimerase GalE [Candidatus Acidoferrales bacterium]|nr:UDP-glucose 4-epimerase GalE [Candidatus Acidoferrales bacterium]
MAKILVTGGAGYIGSVITARLLERGDTPIVFDNFYQGHRWALPPGVEVIQADLAETLAVERLFNQHPIEAVVHMAAISLVGDSVRNPVRYYRENVANLLPLLEIMSRAGCRRLVLSSTAAVYGEPAEVPISEECATVPVNPYGWTKLMCERILADTERAASEGAAGAGGGGFHFVSLRYFNVAGATEASGEMHHPETHLIPRVLEVALGHRPYLELYGDDYPTPDGTCVRDYIHVEDLAEAHVLALDRTRTASGIYNLGNSRGYSVREVVECAARVTQKKIPIEKYPRRPGDPPQLVASHSKAAEQLGWRPRLGLEEMIRSAWEWRLRHPQIPPQ